MIEMGDIEGGIMQLKISEYHEIELLYAKLEELTREPFYFTSITKHVHNQHVLILQCHCNCVQGPTLRLTGRQCDQKLSVGDQKFRTGRQQATNLLSPRHLEFQGKWAFFKRKNKAAVENCSKTKQRFYDRHNYPAPYFFSGFSQF